MKQEGRMAGKMVLLRVIMLISKEYSHFFDSHLANGVPYNNSPN